MRKSKAASAVFAAGLLATLLLSGCGSTSSTGIDPNGKLSGSITFQTWSLKNAKFTPYFNQVISLFEIAHPGTTINWIDQPGDGYSQKVASQVATNSLPDVINLPPDFAYAVAKTGNLMDLSQTDPTLKTDYVVSGVNAYSYVGLKGDFGFPWYLGTDVNYFNKAMFTKDGLDPTKLPTSLDDLIAQAQIMHDKSGGKDYLMSRLPGLNDFADAGSPTLTPDGKKYAFNTDASVAVLDKYVAAVKAGLIPPTVLTGKDSNSDLFKKQEVAWTTGGGNYIQGLTSDEPTLAANVIPAKTFQNAPLYVQGISVSGKSKNPSLALAFAEYVTNTANQNAFIGLAHGFLPGSAGSSKDPQWATSDGTNQGDAAVDAWQDLQTAVNFTPPIWTDAASTILNTEINKALAGQETSKQALDNAVQQMNAQLSE